MKDSKYRENDLVYVEGRLGLITSLKWIETEQLNYYVNIREYCDVKGIEFDEWDDDLFLPTPEYSFGDYWKYSVKFYQTPRINSRNKVPCLSYSYDEYELNGV